MKRLSMLLGLLCVLLLVGCNPSTSSTSSTSKSVGVKAEGVTIVGRDFAGTYTGKGSAEDPTYQYSMHFGKDGQFVQDIIASKGYAGRFTEKGTYKIDKKNNKIIMTITEVTEERFASDEALLAGQAPVAFYKRSSNDPESPLNKAEDHPIDIKRGAKYLVGSVNGVKLYPTKKATVNYTKHYEAEKSKYTKSGGWLSGKTFGNGSSLVAFENGQFIWQYASTEGVVHFAASAQGSYEISASGKEIKFTITAKTPLYHGPNAENFQYNATSAGPFDGPTTMTLTIVSENSLKGTNVGGFNTVELAPQNAGDHYPSLVNQWGVSTVKSKMREVSQQSLTDVFPTVDDFANWVLKYRGESNGTTYYANHRSTDIVNDDERVNKTFKYQVVLQASDNPDDPSPGTAVAITADGKVYEDSDDGDNQRYMKPSADLQAKYDALVQ